MPQHNPYVTFADTLQDEIALHRAYKPNTPSEMVDKLAVLLGYDDEPHLSKLDNTLLSAVCLLAIKSSSSPDNLWQLALRLDSEPGIAIAPSDEIEAKILLLLLGLVKMYRAYNVNVRARYHQVIKNHQKDPAFLALGLDIAA